MSRLIGLLPAAGHARRLGALAGSKEMLPVPQGVSSRPIIDCALDAMVTAGIDEIVVVVRDGKTDLRSHLAARSGVVCLATSPTPSIPHSLDAAYHLTRGRDVVLAFPDVCLRPRGALDAVIDDHREGGDDVVLGLFPSGRPDKTDMVEVVGRRVITIRIKPGPCELEHTWLVAVWSALFTDFLRDFVRRQPVSPRHEIQLSEVFTTALGDGLGIGAHVVNGGRFLDIGTPGDLRLAAEWSTP